MIQGKCTVEPTATFLINGLQVLIERKFVPQGIFSDTQFALIFVNSVARIVSLIYNLCKKLFDD